MSTQDTIKTEVESLVSKMIEEFEVEVTEEEGVCSVIIKTEEASTVIGRHGETIRALQKILEVIVYKKLGESVQMTINVNDYREKQKERLEGIASQLAEKTQSQQRPAYMRGLSSFERKMIHEYITQNYPELTTYSVGEGRDRQLVINTKENEPQETEESPSEENE